MTATNDDLALDALGPNDLVSYGLAVGPNGHVLWSTQVPGTFETVVYLFTPVPEPSALLLALPLLLLRRKSAG